LFEANRPAFLKSAGCEAGACVEVAVGDTVLVRNSDKPDKVLAFSREEWRTFVEGVRLGEFAVDG